MPRFIYAGTHRDKPALSDGNLADHTVMYGLTFPRGIAVEVHDLHAAGKLAGNPYFRIAPEEPGLPVEAPEIGAALAAPGDGVIVTSDGVFRYAADPTPEPVNALLVEPKKKGRRQMKQED